MTMEEDFSIIDKQYLNGSALISFLKDQKELTLYDEAENNFRKNILLSVASFFEKEISDIVVDFAKTHSNNNELIIAIIKAKAVSRQYHTYFSWDGAKNANSFFSLFGEAFKLKMSQKVKEEEKLDTAIKAFLHLGQERNRLVHQNYAEIALEKTADEIYQLYKQALFFVNTLKGELIKTD